MKENISIILVIVIFSPLLIIGVISCSENNRIKNSPLTFMDSTWIEYARAMERKDINYLLKHSLDSIQCVDCQLVPDNNNEYYSAEFVFNNHLNKLMHLQSLSDKKFSTYWSDDKSTFYVNYNVKTKNAPEGGYNLIFIFTNRKAQWKLQGMIVT